MLRISKLADYGCVIVRHISANPDQLASAAAVAKASYIARPTVMKILKLLVEAGLVKSTRGSQGGYYLAKPLAETSVAELIQAIDGQLALTECNLHQSGCVHESYCNLKSPWKKVNQRVLALLQETRLVDMI